MNKPLVSVCIPTYNSAKYLRQCLDSIAEQSYANYEVIISDNCSSDDTVSIIDEYVRKYGFKLYRNEANIGAGLNFIKLVKLAQGDYVAIYHSDDIYDATIIEHSVQVLMSDETIGLVGTLGDSIDELGVPFDTFRLPKHIKKMNKMKYCLDDALSTFGKRGWFFVTPSIMVRKEAYNKLGSFVLNKYGSAGDYEMWLRIACNYNVAIIDKQLMHYRVHKEQGTEMQIRKNLDVADIVLVIDEYMHYAKSARVRRQCKFTIQTNIVKAALRQNYYGLFDKSNVTLRAVTSKRLLLHKYAIRLCNLFGLSVKKRIL